MEKIAWGETVRIKVDAAPEIRPGALAEVICIRQVDNPDQVKEFGVPLGNTILYLEYEDGTAIEVPEKWVERA